MAKKSIEDVLNEIEDFMNSCKTTTLSTNKIIVPRDEFDEIFEDLKVKIPAEIDRCKKIMRNKDAILMDARKNADEIIAQANNQAAQLVSETVIMEQANQKAYETVEMARVQANDILSRAVSEANEIRLGSMQYTNDIMTGIRDYVEATLAAERSNYENLVEQLNNDYLVANANLDEIQNQIVEFTGDPNSVKKAPHIKTALDNKNEPEQTKQKQKMVQKVKQAVGMKGEKGSAKQSAQTEVSQPAAKPAVDIPDFISTGEKVVPNETPLATDKISTSENVVASAETASTNEQINSEGTENQPKKIKKKVVRKRNPVIHTPQTAQETVAKTVEAAAAARNIDKTVYKANGEESRDVPPMEGRVKRGPRVGRGLVEEHIQGEDVILVDTEPDTADAKSLGVVDDFSNGEKF